MDLVFLVNLVSFMSRAFLLFFSDLRHFLNIIHS